MTLWQSPYKAELKKAGWHSRGYLPHFDGREVPQFITLRLFDSIPKSVLVRWQRELGSAGSEPGRLTMQKRIEKYLDEGYGQSFLTNRKVASAIENDLLSFDGKVLKLFAWVVMPNHIHLLMTRFEGQTLAVIMQSFKSLTGHKSNTVLGRHGSFWMNDYFDRYIRRGQHFAKTVRYIENNPVKARLCDLPEDWPFGSARFRLKERLSSD